VKIKQIHFLQDITA